MKSTFTRIIAVSMFIFISFVAWGQNYPYWNGFENVTENNSWQFVGDNNNSANKWVVGTATKLTDQKSLYVSYDNGSTVGYNDQSSTIIVAYRDFVIPEGQSYSVHLDYRHNAKNGDMLYVCWVDDPSVGMPTSITSATLPNWVNDYAKKSVSLNSNAWKPLAFTACKSGKLVFVWQKHNSAQTNANESATIAIDNIQVNRNLDYNYFSGFDNEQQREGWILYSQPNITNRWIIGNAISSTDPSSLYVSSDNSSYGYDAKKPCFVSAVKEFVLPVGESYNVEFDYMCGGNNFDHMYVVWIDNPSDTAFNIWSNNTTFVDNVIIDNAKTVGNSTNKKYMKTPTWQHGSFKVTGKGRGSKLVFLWTNNERVKTTPPAAIDNVSVVKSSSSCPTPNITNIAINGGTAVVEWDYDGISQYQLAYRNAYDTISGMFMVVNNATSPYSITNLSKGSYSIFVRKMCNSGQSLCGEVRKDTTAWGTVHNNIVLTGDGCIDFGNFTAPGVMATANTWSGQPSNQAFANGGAEIGVKPGRHTLVKESKYDPITVPEQAPDDLNNPGLMTVPYGELAVVKLGNHESGAQCEGLEYALNVDAKYSLLMMKYAIVLEDPLNNHAEYERPRFKLEVYDQNDNLVDASCGKAEFIPGVNAETKDWTFLQKKEPYTSVKWKKWTSIGFNLQPYIGQTVKIKVSSWDCELTGHFGYGYFMLNCLSPEISNFSCSSDKLDTVYAPEGFAYCWYKKYQPDGTLTDINSVYPDQCLSSTRGFIAASVNDTTTYACKVMFRDEEGIQPNCYFDVSARLSARFPKAQNEWEVVQEDCKNYVKFTDKSIVNIGTTNDDVPGLEEPKGTRWVVRENSSTGNIYTISSDKNPKIEFPKEGGTYNVMQVSIYNTAKSCNDSTSFTIQVPPVGDITVEQKVVTCQKALPYIWKGQALTVDGKYEARQKTKTGCDSIFKLEFTVKSEIVTEIDSTICDGQRVVWDGETYDKTGKYSKVYKTQYDCDSTVNLNLTVNPVMAITIDPLEKPICADDPDFTFNYKNTGGSEPSKYTLSFKEGTLFDVSNGEFDVETPNSMVIPIPENIRPDKYEVKIDFIDTVYKCQGTSLTVPFEVCYPSSIIEQNWNDVVALLNKKYNGGYEFSKYQWYKNGVAIDGQTKSYLYLPEGLEIDARYMVHLTRNGEDYAIYSCPIVAQPYTKTQTPTLVEPNQRIKMHDVSEPAYINIYSVAGILISTQRITPQNMEYTIPNKEGIYFVEVRYDSGFDRKYKIVVNR